MTLETVAQPVWWLLPSACNRVGSGLEHWTRVHNHDHQATVAAKENSKFERNAMEKYI
ncbi:hypothetical protein TNCV_1668751 [Trichonephila clavipes]|nr:hypothetical protein TNCV_1668751 [Trichonephila clavipes]